MAKTIEDVIAESEIKDVHLRYCRANDRLDAELMRSCFHPDAVIEMHQTFDVESFIAMGRAALANFTLTWHNTGNQLVEVDGDTAWAEHYTTSSHRMPASDSGPERDLIAFGRYNDRMEKRDGEWRIARRVMVADFMRLDVNSTPDFPLGGVSGARDPSDPSYGLRLRR